MSKNVIVVKLDAQFCFDSSYYPLFFVRPEVSDINLTLGPTKIIFDIILNCVEIKNLPFLCLCESVCDSVIV